MCDTRMYISVHPGNPAANGEAAAPDDDSIIKDIEHWVKRKAFDTAKDLLRDIKDDKLREFTKARIGNAETYVATKGAK